MRIRSRRAAVTGNDVLRTNLRRAEVKGERRFEPGARILHSAGHRSALSIPRDKAATLFRDSESDGKLAAGLSCCRSRSGKSIENKNYE